MPIKVKREGNACEKCKKLDTEVGPITHYTDPHDGYEGLLCSECIKRREKPYTEICPKCKRVAYEHGGLTYYDDSDADDLDDEISDNYDSFDDFDYDEKPPSFESMCMECHEKKVARVRKIQKVKLTIKNFGKDNWKFWIIISVSIIGVTFTAASFLASSPIDFNSETDGVVEECITGEFGLTIRNCESGFEITRADYGWVRTTDINQFAYQHGNPLINSSNYLGGVILGKKGQGTVSVHVVNSTNYSSENAFEEFVNSFYVGKKSQFPDFMIKEPFFVGKTAIIEMEGEYDSAPLILINKIEEYNEKFYIFTTSYRTDMINLDDFRSEQDQVINSFNYLD